MVRKSEEEEMYKKYKDRLETPKENWIKYEGPDQLWEIIMENKKKNGWKFKDEK